MQALFLDIDNTCICSIHTKVLNKIMKANPSSSIPKFLAQSIATHVDNIGEENILTIPVDGGYSVLPRPGLSQFLNFISKYKVYVLSSADHPGYLDKIIPFFNIPAIEIFSTRDYKGLGTIGKKVGIFSDGQFISNQWCLVDDQLPIGRNSLADKFNLIGFSWDEYQNMIQANTFDYPNFNYVHCAPWYGTHNDSDGGLNGYKVKAFINEYMYGVAS